MTLLADRGSTGTSTVAEVMATRPKTLPVDASVAAVRAALADPHVHLVLLVAVGVLHGTVARDDLLSDPAPDLPAMRVATLAGRTVGPDVPVDVARERLAATGARRLAVVGPGGELLGLLCRKRVGTGFCSDEGVAARAVDAI